VKLQNAMNKVAISFGIEIVQNKLFTFVSVQEKNQFGSAFNSKFLCKQDKALPLA
jgi:hypothetical protein